jgi:glycosyltransferase involved in cell wall biosynthesis
MRVAVLTPLDERSAIAGYTLRALAAVPWDVEIWYPACERPRWTAYPTHPFHDGAEVVGQLAGYDLVLHVVGNSDLHVEVLRAARRRPGLVVLHDRGLWHLVVAADDRTGSGLAADAAERTGEPALDLFRRYRTGEPGLDDELSELLPMTEVALQDSLGVVTHSRWMAEQVRAQTIGAVAVAALPHEVPVVPDAVPHSGERVDPDTVLVVSGVINANKCVDRLIASIAGSPLLRERLLLRVAGPINEARRLLLAEQAATAGVAHRVELLGGLPKTAFEAALGSADAFACLRDPVMEASSASLLQSMGLGRPVVVLDHGHYAELPQGTVVKVDPADPDALTRALEGLVRDPSAGAATGLRGREHVIAAHGVEQYAETLVAAAADAVRARPLVEAVARRRRDLATLGLTADEHARRKAAEALHQLFVRTEAP